MVLLKSLLIIAGVFVGGALLGFAGGYCVCCLMHDFLDKRVSHRANWWLRLIAALLLLAVPSVVSITFGGPWSVAIGGYALGAAIYLGIRLLQNEFESFLMGSMFMVVVLLLIPSVQRARAAERELRERQKPPTTLHASDRAAATLRVARLCLSTREGREDAQRVALRLLSSGSSRVTSPGGVFGRLGC